MWGEIGIGAGREGSGGRGKAIEEGGTMGWTGVIRIGEWGREVGKGNGVRKGGRGMVEMRVGSWRTNDERESAIG